MQRQVAQLQASYTRLGETMAKARMAADPADKSKVFNQQLTQLGEINKLYNNAAMASGNWHVQNVKTLSSSEAFTQGIIRQKVGLKGAISAISDYAKGQGVLNEVIKEQNALRNSMSTQMTSSLFGKNTSSLMVPKGLSQDLMSARVQYGTINSLLQSAATQTINWGKNTQWAGRQLTVGLSMPLAMAAAAAGALAFQVDKELTNVAKVYDTTSQTQMGQEKELSQVRAAGLDTATRMAKTYGSSMKDVLSVQAQLAASGVKGQALQQSTADTTRIAVLGEMDYQKALQMTISLQTAFKLSGKDLTDTFNFMNSVENSTSLTLQDMADAVPRAASAFSALGGTVQDMTVALAAMKESGVDADEAANALKSATSRILKPTKDAVTYFSNTFGIDLEKVVTDANGNILEVIKTLAGLTHGYSDLAKQKGIDELFGTYQFNRISALWNNLGDAMTGTANQTKKAMDVAGQSTEQWADTAAAETARWQKSTSARFKIAVASIQAELVPLGMTVLNVLTPIIGWVASLIGWFNKLPGPVKTILLVAAGFAAVAGPVLMLVGLMANLFGNLMKGGTSLANLVLRFKLLTPEERAAALNAKAASSAFDSEARSAAYLAEQVRALTVAMEEQAVASGAMAMSPRGNAVANGNKRTVAPMSNGILRYGAGSRNAAGEDISYSPVSKEDRANYQAIQGSSKEVAANAEKTRMSMTGVGKGVGMLAAGAVAMMAMKSGADGTLDTVMNIAMTAGTIGFMFPGIFTKAGQAAKGLAGVVTNMFAGGAAGVSKLGTSMSRLWTAFRVGGLTGPLGITGQIAAMAPKFASVASAALRIFGPVGILAGAIIIFKALHDEQTKMARAQEEINNSTKDWATILGYASKQSDISESADKKGVAATMSRKDAVDQLTKGNKALADSLVQAKNANDGLNSVYNLAMTEAVKVKVDSGDTTKAKQAFNVALQAAGVGEQEIEKLDLKFNTVNLDNPEEVARQLMNQINSAALGMSTSNLTPGLIEGVLANGPGASDKAKAVGMQVGSNFATAMAAAANDPQQQNKLGREFGSSMDTMFQTSWNELNQGDNAELFKKMGIKNMQDYMTALAEAKKAAQKNANPWNPWDYGEASGDQQSLLGTQLGKQAEAAIAVWKNVTRTIGQAKGLQGPALDDYVNNMNNVKQVMQDMGAPIMSAKEAEDEYNKAVNDSIATGHGMSDAEKLKLLNVERAKAGLGEAKDITVGFTDATDNAASSSATAAKSLDDLASAAAKVAITQDMATGYIKDEMGGTMSDIYQEADRRFQEQEQNTLDGIKKRGEAASNALDAQGKAQDKMFSARQDAMQEAADQASKAQQKMFKQQDKDLNNFYDNRIKQVQAEADAVDASYDAQKKGLQDQIDAEQKAESIREKIFQAEQTRIQRMAQTANSNIDFNAALNSGNLDEAAKIQNTQSAQVQQWNLDDSQGLTQDASQARQDAIQKEIDNIDQLQKARKDAYDQQLDQIKEAQKAAEDALQERQQAEEEALQAQQKRAEKALQIEQQNAQDRLQAQKDANSKATDDATASAQAQFEADKRGLAMRLAELQAFTPRNEAELRDHIGKVEQAYADYGFNLQVQGNGWAGYIGNALKTNVNVATISLQNDINWQALGNVIAGRISAGIGVTANDLQTFIRTGQFPAQVPGGGGANTGMARLGVAAVRHSGGFGDPSWSQADRVGVPRSAGLYPTEIPAILKRGEFVVNEKATAKHQDLLSAINSGMIVRHEGGLADVGPLIAGGIGMMYAMTLEKALIQAGLAEKSREAAAAMGGDTGGYSGKGMTWPALDRIRQHLFPGSVLTDDFRPGASDWHGAGDAIDIGWPGNAQSGLMPIAERLAQLYPNSTELIHNPNGSIKNGKPVPPGFWGASTWAQHANHVHWAMTPEALNAVAASAAMAGGGPAAVGSNQQIVQQKAAQMYGWTGAEWNALYQLVMHESGFNNNAQNPTSTAYGMFQFLNSTWGGYGIPKTSDPNLQAVAGLRYIASKYHDPIGAWSFWQGHHWYDQGGYLGPDQIGHNTSGKPEPVFTSDQWSVLQRAIDVNMQAFDAIGSATSNVPAMAPAVASGGDNYYDVTVDLRGSSIREEIDVKRAVAQALDEAESRRGRNRRIS